MKKTHEWLKHMAPHFENIWLVHFAILEQIHFEASHVLVDYVHANKAISCVYIIFYHIKHIKYLRISWRTLFSMLNS